MLVPESDEGVAMLLAERIRKRVGETPCIYEDTEITVICSIGVAVRVGNESLEELLKYADQALYQAKDGGRNKTVLYQATDAFQLDSYRLRDL